jgi:hypothetical protein
MNCVQIAVCLSELRISIALCVLLLPQFLDRKEDVQGENPGGMMGLLEKENPVVEGSLSC